MSKLTPTLPLNGYSREWDGISLFENYSGELVSLAVMQGEETKFEAAFKSVFKTLPPKPNQYIRAGDDIVLWSGAGQYLAMMNGEDLQANQTLSAKFGNAAYTTLQSDGWASLSMSGERIYDILERFIALDLRAAEDNFSARTTAHHIAVIIIKISSTKFTLLTPRSSANSFLSALEHIIKNVAQL